MQQGKVSVSSKHTRKVSYASIFDAWTNLLSTRGSRVARWYSFNPEISIWVNFGGSSIALEDVGILPFGVFYGFLIDTSCPFAIYFPVVWYIFPRFGKLCQEQQSGNPARLSNAHMTYHS
jgi:hypothetical protein